MSRQTYRVANGLLNDSGEEVRFTFNGKTFSGQRGDTVAAALMANGVMLMGRSFKYHRPRGPMSAGFEEANALMTVGTGAKADTNVRATTAEIYPGMVVKSQNHKLSLRYDLMEINSLASPIFGAGFYYKTFMGLGLKGWMFFEDKIRKAAGLGVATKERDPDTYEKMNAFCDIAIVGGGPSGLLAALEAARSGLKVMLIEQNAHFGGQVMADGNKINNETPAEWVGAVVSELQSRDNVTLLNRTTAWGYYDGNNLALTERITDHLADDEKPEGWCRQRLWRLIAKKVILATGALERPLLFKNNDRPGIMLAGAVRTYLAHYGVSPGENMLCVGNDDSIYETAFKLNDLGIQVRVVDMRSDVPEALEASCKARGIDLHQGAQPLAASGRMRVNQLTIRTASGSEMQLTCDAVAVSGGWSPTVHLASQAGGKPVFDQRLQAFLPGQAREDWVATGAVQGVYDTKACFEAALSCVRGVIADLDHDVDGRTALPTVENALPMRGQRDAQRLLDLEVPHAAKSFLDYQHDVTAKDVSLAHREGFVSVEHLKRYTTLGMATDQGRTSNVLGLALMAKARGMDIPQVGTTTFRAPFSGVTMGALVGRETGMNFRPVRKTPMHSWHQENGAVFIEAGPWHRAHYYPESSSETLREAYIREAQHVRDHCGICDVSTLGKIDVQGPDAAEFLNRIYANGFAKLPIGKARYGIMLREDGIPFDDGTTSRISEHQYYLTTTTGEAAQVMHWLEHKLDVVWPDLKVAVSSISDQWANVALAGPKARDVLANLVDVDVSDAAMPFMACLDTEIEDKGETVPLRIFRISFSGELGYELATPSKFGRRLWEKLLAVGISSNLQPYGLEAMGALRVEKGFITHSDMNGRVTMQDLGYGRMASTKKDYIGREMMTRPGLQDPDRPQLVGIVGIEEDAPIAGGGQIVADPNPVAYTHTNRCDMLGHISSTTYSPVLGRNVGLGFVRGGFEGRENETLYVADPVRGNHYAIRVTSPDMIGARS